MNGRRNITWRQLRDQDAAEARRRRNFQWLILFALLELWIGFLLHVNGLTAN